MQSQKLSIITVCLNQARDIARTCESVVRQTWRDFEWIVVDGGSTDGTVDILEQYRSRCAALVSEPDSGVYNAMNKGLARAAGEYVLFLNGGDRLVGDDVLGRVFGGGGSEPIPGADIVYGDILLERDGAIAGRAASPDAEDVDFLFFAAGETLPHPASFIRRSLFLRHGGYDESYRIAGDVERWAVFAKNGCSFARIDRVVSVFQSGGISDDKQPTNKIRLAELDKMRKTHYTVDEVAAARRRKKEKDGYAVVRSFLPLGAGVSLFSRQETRRGVKKVKWCVLGFPVLKKRPAPPPSAGSVYRLLGLIPFGAEERR